MKTAVQYSRGDIVKFDVGQGLDVGIATIAGFDVEIDDDGAQIYYRLDVLKGSRADLHRNKDGELWVNEFEIVSVI
jgi:hypothetical protein